MSVVLIGDSGDRQIQAVTDALEARGITPDQWDPEAWPGPEPLTFAQTDDGVEMTVHEPVGDIDAVYLRRFIFDPTAPEFEGDLEERPYGFMNQLNEYRGVAMSVLRYLGHRGVRVVNPPQSSSIHSLKPFQLTRLAEAGLPVPETCSTNDPGKVRAFLDRVEEGVYKPVSGGGYARPIDADSLDDQPLDRLANAPVQFQERIDGDNLRLYVVDGELVAAGRILSDELDYRTEDHEIERLDPRPEIERAAVRAAEVFDLPFAGVDIIDEGDRFVVLEVNPSPMFAVFDDKAGTDVAGPLAELLSK